MPTTLWQRRKLSAPLQVQLLQVCQLTDVGWQHHQGASLLRYKPKKALHLSQSCPLTKAAKVVAASEIQSQLGSLHVLCKTL